MTTRSDAVVRILVAAGGTASRRAVLDALAAELGSYREAVVAVATAWTLGRVERVIRPDGRVGLALCASEVVA